MRVLRVYHAGRDPAHRRRERALVDAGLEVRLVVPSTWPDAGAEARLGAEPFEVTELDVRRAGDVNRHRYRAPGELRAVLDAFRPDILDIHEEPFSLAARQWLDVAGDTPTVLYTAQNLDKRYPPPFAQYERRAYRQVRGLYPCSRQAASVARGKGFGGVIDVLPLGVDLGDYRPGSQRHADEPFVLGLVGRMVPEKGVRDAVRVLAAVSRQRPARLHLVGEGPEVGPARELAAELGVEDHLEVTPWVGVGGMAAAYARMHVLLVPSTSTATWVEQFGRVLIEGQACGCVVAGYDSGTIAEVCAGTGLLAPEGQVSALCEGVVALATDAGRWQQLRRAGLDRPHPCTWQQVAAGQVHLYEKVLAEASARAGRRATPVTGGSTAGCPRGVRAAGPHPGGGARDRPAGAADLPAAQHGARLGGRPRLPRSWLPGPRRQP